MIYDPQTDKYPYPEFTDRHYLVVKKNNGAVFDRDYPYIDCSRAFRFKQFWVRVLLRTVVFPVAIVRLGLRVKGRKNLKKYKDLLDGGAISCCNHVHLWDYICVMYALRPRRPRYPAWAKNLRGENATLIRLTGGVPVPENDMGATRAFLKAIEGHLVSGGWLHVYAEGSMWEYYAPIRPFKSGVSYFACRCRKPVVPMAFSYRKPNWLRRRVFGQIACFTLNVGEPIFPDETLPRKEREQDLTVRCHRAVCRLAGIEPKDNIYEPVYSKSRRVDYYTDTYGVKG